MFDLSADILRVDPAWEGGGGRETAAGGGSLADGVYDDCHGGSIWLVEELADEMVPNAWSL